MKSFLSCLVLLVSVALCSSACKSKQTANEPGPAKPAETKPAKVLIHNSHQCECAADGYLFLVYIYAFQNKWAAQQPELAKGLSLESANGLTVTQEAIDSPEESKKLKEKAEPPKTNPKDFDFFIKHAVDYKEEQKKSFDAPLRLTVKETWTVEKVSDPSIKTTQTATYVLDAGSKIEEMEKVTEDQIDKVIKPALAPLLKEISAFIESKR